MSSHDTHTRDDAEFDLFLERSGELAQQLQSLPQPEPSAQLDAAILARAEKNLAAGSRLANEASNDAVIPGARPVRPIFFQRMQVPMGLAASVMVAVLVTLQWEARSPDDMPVLVAQAPQAEEWPEPRAAAKRPPTTSAESPTVPSPVPRSEADTSALNRQESAEQREAERFRIAQAEMAERERSAAPVDPAPAAASTSAPVPTASAPPVSKLVRIPPAHEAKPWLALIEELWKADLQPEAVEEWKQFQKSYPDYPVPEKLKKALNEAAKEQAAR